MASRKARPLQRCTVAVGRIFRPHSSMQILPTHFTGPGNARDDCADCAGMPGRAEPSPRGSNQKTSGDIWAAHGALPSGGSTHEKHAESNVAVEHGGADGDDCRRARWRSRWTISKTTRRRRATCSSTAWAIRATGTARSPRSTRATSRSWSRNGPSRSPTIAARKRFPLVKDGVIYVTSHHATVAVDAMTGKQIWRVNHEYPPETLARGLLRHRQSRRRDLQRQDHSRAARQPHHRARRQDRQGGLEDAVAGAGRHQERLCDDRRAARRQRRGHRRRGRRRIQPSRLRRRLRSGDRQASLAALHHPGQGRARLGHLGGRFRADRRRQQLGHRHLRSGARSGLLGHRQSVAVERPRAQGRQSLHQLDLRGQAEDRRARLVLPDVAERSVRL